MEGKGDTLQQRGQATDAPCAELSPSTSSAEPVPSTSRFEPVTLIVTFSQKKSVIKPRSEQQIFSNDDSDTGVKKKLRVEEEYKGRQVSNINVIVDLNCLQSLMTRSAHIVMKQ